MNGKGRTGGCGAAGALRGRWDPAAGRFSGAGEAGGLGRAMRFRSSWRGFRAARVRLCCEGRNGCRGPERCGMGCGARRFSDVRRVRLKGPEVPSGRRFPESATWKNRCGVGGVAAGSAELGGRRAAVGSARSAVRSGGSHCEKPRPKPGVRDAACGLRTEGPASVRGDSSGGYGLRLAPGPVSGFCPRLRVHRASTLSRVHRAPGFVPGFCSRARAHARSFPGSGTCYLRMGRMTRAGLPATMVSAGTSCVTTEPAPTMAFSPMVTPGSTTEQAPIQALRRMRIGRP